MGVCCLLDSSSLNQLMTPRCTALHNAAGKGHLDIVKMLVGAGADINIRCKDNIRMKSCYNLMS